MRDRNGDRLLHRSDPIPSTIYTPLKRPGGFSRQASVTTVQKGDLEEIIIIPQPNFFIPPPPPRRRTEASPPPPPPIERDQARKATTSERSPLVGGKTAGKLAPRAGNRDRLTARVASAVPPPPPSRRIGSAQRSPSRRGSDLSRRSPPRRRSESSRRSPPRRGSELSRRSPPRRGSEVSRRSPSRKQSSEADHAKARRESSTTAAAASAARDHRSVSKVESMVPPPPPPVKGAASDAADKQGAILERKASPRPIVAQDIPPPPPPVKAEVVVVYIPPPPPRRPSHSMEGTSSPTIEVIAAVENTVDNAERRTPPPPPPLPTGGEAGGSASAAGKPPGPGNDSSVTAVVSVDVAPSVVLAVSSSPTMLADGAKEVCAASADSASQSNITGKQSPAVNVAAESEALQTSVPSVLLSSKEIEEGRTAPSGVDGDDFMTDVPPSPDLTSTPADSVVLQPSAPLPTAEEAPPAPAQPAKRMAVKGENVALTEVLLSRLNIPNATTTAPSTIKVEPVVEVPISLALVMPSSEAGDSRLDGFRRRFGARFVSRHALNCAGESGAVEGVEPSLRAILQAGDLSPPTTQQQLEHCAGFLLVATFQSYEEKEAAMTYLEEVGADVSDYDRANPFTSGVLLLQPPPPPPSMPPTTMLSTTKKSSVKSPPLPPLPGSSITAEVGPITGIAGISQQQQVRGLGRRQDSLGSPHESRNFLGGRGVGMKRPAPFEASPRDGAWHGRDMEHHQSHGMSMHPQQQQGGFNRFDGGGGHHHFLDGPGPYMPAVPPIMLPDGSALGSFAFGMNGFAGGSPHGFGFAGSSPHARPPAVGLRGTPPITQLTSESTPEDVDDFLNKMVDIAEVKLAEKKAEESEPGEISVPADRLPVPDRLSGDALLNSRDAELREAELGAAVAAAFRQEAPQEHSHELGKSLWRTLPNSALASAPSLNIQVGAKRPFPFREIVSTPPSAEATKEKEDREKKLRTAALAMLKKKKVVAQQATNTSSTSSRPPLPQGGSWPTLHRKLVLTQHPSGDGSISFTAGGLPMSKKFKLENHPSPNPSRLSALRRSISLSSNGSASPPARKSGAVITGNSRGIEKRKETFIIDRTNEEVRRDPSRYSMSNGIFFTAKGDAIVPAGRASLSTFDRRITREGTAEASGSLAMQAPLSLPMKRKLVSSEDADVVKGEAAASTSAAEDKAQGDVTDSESNKRLKDEGGQPRAIQSASPSVLDKEAELRQLTRQLEKRKREQFVALKKKERDMRLANFRLKIQRQEKALAALHEDIARRTELLPQLERTVVDCQSEVDKLNGILSDTQTQLAAASITHQTISMALIKARGEVRDEAKKEAAMEDYFAQERV